MRNQEGKGVIELPRTPANAWLFEKKAKNKHAESENEKNKTDDPRRQNTTS